MTAANPVLIEEEMLHDGEPVFAMAWGQTEPHGLPDRNRWGPSRTINRNIAGLSTVTPGAAITSQPADAGPAGFPSEIANPVSSRTRARPGGSGKSPTVLDEDRGHPCVRTESDSKHKSSGHPVGVKVHE